MLGLAARAKATYADEGTGEGLVKAIRGGVAHLDSRPLVGVGASVLHRVIYVDANAPADPFPGDPNAGDPDEDGTSEHPFDSVFEAMVEAADGDTILVAPGHYAPVDGADGRLEFAGRSIQLRSRFEEDLTLIEQTVLDATIVFDGTEGPECELAGFAIRGSAFEGIFGNGTAATLRHCAVQGNRTCDGSVLTDFHGHMAHCLIADNTSTFACGSRPAVVNFSGTMINCTIANNATGISVHNAEVINCIIYYNGIQTIRVQDKGSLALLYCNVQGGEHAVVASSTKAVGMASIMALNPRFAKLGVWQNGRFQKGDYHLKSQGLRWSPEPVADSHWVRDAVTSPCIDGGDPCQNLDAEALGFPAGTDIQSQVNWRINMGCYGGTAQASLPFVKPIVGITATASSSDSEGSPEATCNGSGLDALDQHSALDKTMWVSSHSDESPWILYEFNRVYRLYEMWVWNYNVIFEPILNFGAKDVTIEYSEDGINWTLWGDVAFAQASARADYTANTIVSLGGITARYVRFAIDSGWGVFGQVGLSEVRFFADLTPRSEPGVSYEVVLDTFEAYTDDGTNLIYHAWLDGWVNETGSIVGYLTEPFAEQWIVNSGLQSMPLFYDNAGAPYYSETSRELAPELQNWYVGAADGLTLYVHGSLGEDHNAEPDRFYVAVEDARGRIAAVYHPDALVLFNDDWQEWTIGFSEFADVDLNLVRRLILGVGDRNDPRPGRSGVVYIDDIGLSVGAEQTDRVFPISNVVATSNIPSEEGVGPENTVNGSGLNEDGEHSTEATTMWLAEIDRASAYIQFAFDDVYEVHEMRVWNYNVMFERLLRFGVKDVTVEYSVNGTDWTSLGAVQFAQAPARDDYAAYTTVEFGDVAAQYVRLEIYSAWGPLGQVGLSEVQFWALGRSDE